MNHNYGPVSVMAYASLITWAFWQLWTFGTLTGWTLPLIALFLYCTVAAKSFAQIVHGRLSS